MGSPTVVKPVQTAILKELAAVTQVVAVIARVWLLCLLTPLAFKYRAKKLTT
jgi:hypothetical protein